MEILSLSELEQLAQISVPFLTVGVVFYASRQVKEATRARSQQQTISRLFSLMSANKKFLEIPCSMDKLTADGEEDERHIRFWNRISKSTPRDAAY